MIGYEPKRFLYASLTKLTKYLLRSEISHDQKSQQNSILYFLPFLFSSIFLEFRKGKSILVSLRLAKHDVGTKTVKVAILSNFKSIQIHLF